MTQFPRVTSICKRIHFPTIPYWVVKNNSWLQLIIVLEKIKPNLITLDYKCICMVHQLRLRFSLCIDIWVGITIRYLAPTVCQVLNGPPEESHSQQFFRLGHGPILPKKTGWRWKFRFFFSHSSCLSDSYFVMKTLLPGYRIFGLPKATGDYFIGQSYAFLIP